MTSRSAKGSTTLSPLAWGLLLLAASAQAGVAGAHAFDDDLVFVAWAALLLLAAGTLALGRLLRQEGWQGERPYLLIAALFAFWLGVVYWGSIAPARSLYFTWAWWSALLLIPVARLAFREDWSGRLLLAVLLPAAIVALDGAWTAFRDDLSYWAIDMDPNILADRLLAVTLLMLAGWYGLRIRTAAAGPWLQRMLATSIVAWVLLLAVLLQQGLGSRAIMLAYPVALLAMALLLRRPWLWALPALVAMVFGLTWIAPDIFVVGSGGDHTNLDRFSNVAAGHAVGSRWQLWMAALQLMPQGLLTGVGLNGFAVVYAPMRAATDTTTGIFVHNDWLQLTLEAGVPFLLLLLIVGFLFLRAFFRLCWARGAMGSVTLAWPQLMGVVAGLIAGVILAHALGNFPLYDPALLSVLVVCVVLCISSAERGISFAERGIPAAAGVPEVQADETSTAKPLAAVRVWTAPALAVLGLLLWLPAMGHALTWSLLREQPIFPGLPPVTLTDQEHFAWSTRLHAWGLGHGVPAFMQAGWAAQFYRLAEGESKRELAEMAVNGFTEARAAQPWQADFDTAFARFLHETGRIDLQVRQAILEDSIRRDPAAPGVWLELARQLDDAERWQSEAHRLVPIWQQHCYFMAAVDAAAFEGFYRMIPEDLLDEGPEMRRCQSLVKVPHLQRLLNRRR